MLCKQEASIKKKANSTFKVIQKVKSYGEKKNRFLKRSSFCYMGFAAMINSCIQK